MSDLTVDRIRRAYATAKAALLAEIVSEPVAAGDPVQKMLDAPVGEMRHWVGQLSTSALSTATAVMALEQMRRQYVSAGRDVPKTWTRLIRGGIQWLIVYQNSDGGWGDTVKSISNISTTMLCHAVLRLASGGRQPPDASEPLTRSISQSHARGQRESCDIRRDEDIPRIRGLTPPARNDVIGAAQAYIDRAGGVKAVIQRYGKDRTFSVPILTHCALAGLVDWDDIISLPFELACIPARFYTAVRLPVVSYALPALIAVGQVRFHFRPSRNPLRRWLQRWAKPASLKVLERIQPPNGGFLEATPLTSFVTMSLAAMGLIDHPVTRRGVEFIVASVRWEVGWDSVPTYSTNDSFPTASEDSGSGQSPNLRSCSWPIDTDLATWVTTLSINALGDDVPLDARPGLRAWLLRQQYRVVHPYTNAVPGGWAWTDLPGGVPDADDTAGAMLALMNLEPVMRPLGNGPNRSVDPRHSVLSTQYSVSSLGQHRPTSPAAATKSLGDNPHVSESVRAACTWLLQLQNRDGGWPTFCRGWGTLPFDRSSPDISAHALRALNPHATNIFFSNIDQWIDSDFPDFAALLLFRKRYVKDDIWLLNGLKFLRKSQRPDGSWLPLWFGNQHAPNEENPTYGTAKVLAAFQALGRMSDESAVRGVRWLVANQNPDGGWGAGPGTPSSVEETALAVEALLGQRPPSADHAPRDEPSADRARYEGPASVSSSEQQGRSAPHAEREGYVAEGYVDGDEAAISFGLSWLIARVEDGRFREPAPIGFYFAKLWYFEALYPLIFTVAALRSAVEATRGIHSTEPME